MPLIGQLSQWLWIAASVSETEAADTLSAIAAVRVSGTLSAVEAPDTLSAVAAVRVSGTLSENDAADTLASNARVVVHGTLSATEVADGISAAAKVVIHATLAVSEASDALAATESAAVNGALNVSEAADLLSSSTAVLVRSTAAIAEAADALSATTQVRIAGSAAISEDPDILAATVGDIHAAADLLEAADTLSASASGPQAAVINQGGGGGRAHVIRRPETLDDWFVLSPDISTTEEPAPAEPKPIAVEKLKPLAPSQAQLTATEDDDHLGAHAGTVVTASGHMDAQDHISAAVDVAVAAEVMLFEAGDFVRCAAKSTISAASTIAANDDVLDARSVHDHSEEEFLLMLLAAA